MKTNKEPCFSILSIIVKNSEYLYYCRTKVVVGGAAVSRLPPPPPGSKMKREDAAGKPAALIAVGQLGVAVAPLLWTALLHMAPPRPQLACWLLC